MYVIIYIYIHIEMYATIIKKKALSWRVGGTKERMREGMFEGLEEDKVGRKVW